MRLLPAALASHRGLSWLVVLGAILIATAVLLGWWQMQEQARAAQIVAQVNGKPISRLDLGEALRSHLWVRGLLWDNLEQANQNTARQEALEGLIDARLLQDWVQSRRPGAHPVPAHGTEAFQQFLKQFEETGGWVERSAWQGMNEATLQSWLESETLAREAVEAEITAMAPQVTDAEARQWFEANGKKLLLPERMRVDHLFLGGHDTDKPDRDSEIRELHRQITAGEATLTSLASRLSEDPRSVKTGGSLGWLSRERVPEDFAARVFPLRKGQLSEPFRSGLGWHIALVRERAPLRAPLFEEVKTAIKAQLSSARRLAAVSQFRAGLRNEGDIKIYEPHLLGVAPLP